MQATTIHLRKLGLQGIVKNKARGDLLPAEAYSLLNFMPYDGKLCVTPGVALVTQSTMSGAPRALLSWLRDDGNVPLVLVTSTKAYKYIDSTLTDITRESGPYTGAISSFVDMTIFGAACIFTNGSDAIQKWDGSSDHFVALGGSPPVVATLTTAMTFLVLAGVASYPRRVQWSDSGNAEAYTGGDSGYLTLYQGPGEVMRLLTLGDSIIAYRRNNIHLLYYVGPPFIWGQRQVFSSNGLLAAGAVVDIDGRHFYLGNDYNIYAFDGANKIALGDSVRQEIQKSIDVQYEYRCFAVVHAAYNHIYFYFPPLGTGGVCTDAWVLDYKTGRIHRVSSQKAIAAGAPHMVVVSTAWTDLVGSWLAQELTWQQLLGVQSAPPTTVLVSTTGQIGYINTNIDTIFNTGVSKEYESGLFCVDDILTVSYGTNKNTKWTCNKLSLEYEVIGSVTIQVSVGVLDTLLSDSSIVWKTYTVTLDGSRVNISTRETGRYHCIRVVNNEQNVNYKLLGATGRFVRKGFRAL